MLPPHGVWVTEARSGWQRNNIRSLHRQRINMALYNLLFNLTSLVELVVPQPCFDIFFIEYNFFEGEPHTPHLLH